MGNNIISFIPLFLAFFSLLISEMLKSKRSSEITLKYRFFNSLIIDKFEDFIHKITEHYSSEVLRLITTLNPDKITLDEFMFKPFNYEYKGFYKEYEKLEERKISLNRALYRIQIFRFIFLVILTIVLLLFIFNLIIQSPIFNYINIIVAIIIFIIMLIYMMDYIRISNKLDDIEKDYDFSK